MKPILEWIWGRLSEGSTWRGIILLATSAGVHLSQDHQEAILCVGLAVIGLINVIRKEKQPVPAVPPVIPKP